MKENIRKKLEAFRQGKLSEADFLLFLENFPYSDKDHIKLDFHRRLRRGVPEVVYGRDKSPEQLQQIIARFIEVGEDMLITRVDDEKFRWLKKKFPRLIYHTQARMVTSARQPTVLFANKLLVLSAGAADAAVAEEAYISALFLGNRCDREYDVGVACLSRALALRERLNDYAVVIVVAGMEGALPSVIAGLTATPVIAVPTSVGYGANFGGLSALLAMLNSCSGGVSVVNIDNGFGAAFQATLINQKISGRVSSKKD